LQPLPLIKQHNNRAFLFPSSHTTLFIGILNTISVSAVAMFLVALS
jgi:hypothetical protein